jgi:hypothetical protein
MNVNCYKQNIYTYVHLAINIALLQLTIPLYVSMYVRIYIYLPQQLKPKSESSSLSDEDVTRLACEKPQILTNDFINMNKTIQIPETLDFKQYVNILSAARDACSELRLIPLYCYTSSHTFRREMFHKGLVLSPVDQAEPGIFFTTKSPCSLGIDNEK